MVWESVYMELTSTNTILYLFTIARQQLTPVDVRVLATIRLPSELVCNKTKTTVKDRREEEKVPMQSKVYNFLVYFYFLAICHCPGLISVTLAGCVGRLDPINQFIQETRTCHVSEP